MLYEQSLISIVDDDLYFRESLGRLLKALGYAVGMFPSAVEFLASPKLIITACLIADVHMPVLSGDELYKLLRTKGHAIPTILVTAYPDDDMQRLMLAEGVSCYLRKPLDEDQLIGCLRYAIAMGSARQGPS